MGLHDLYPAYGGRGPGDLKIGLSLGAIATIFMIMRVYVRLRLNKFGTTALIWSLVAWTFTSVTQSMSILSILYGQGQHIDIVSKTGNLEKYLVFTWVTVFLFSIAIPIGKVAVCAFLLEMNGPGNPKTRLSLYIVGGVNVLFAIPQLVIIWTQCSPVNALWDPNRQELCHTSRAAWYTAFLGAIAAISDLYLAIIPAAMLGPLQIDIRLKLGLSFLMGCGVFAAASAIVRSWACQFILVEDSTYGTGLLFRWGEIEEWVVLICMSIPPVWPLLRPITSKFIASSNGKSSQGPYTSKGYNQFASTGRDLTSTVEAPIVTTTISISSNKNGGTTGTERVETSSSDSIIRYDEERPHNVLNTSGDPEGWVEMTGYNKHTQ
ncbi:hypothetical protein N7495_010010 [Penicillium taxi]|uniref:uncharacterized protein n=1 Tax=Penicillium taxi TaxID=168475 RepID=UPI00254578F1|nr:uncharacterized protein N7495_010010 [Penicillium taxi]KAJ5885500.1 hypothetical protein N7495_010010 [Penicillium taxi]